MARAIKTHSKHKNDESTLTKNIGNNPILLEEAEALLMNVVQPVDNMKTNIGKDISGLCAAGLQEEHKQLLVRAVRKRIQRQMSEDDIWNEIERETGYNHRILWKDMKNVTMKKLMCLLPANDFLEKIPADMHLNSTDWLLFDLILVHEQVDVVNIISTENNYHKEAEPECLQELFELVKEYNIENLSGEALVVAWRQITLQYNCGSREISPMLLQLRWFQLKQLTRERFYNSYDGCQVYPSVVIEPTVLQIAIAVAFNSIITREVIPTWETLIRDKRVILPEEFDKPPATIDNTHCPSASEKPELESTPQVLLLTLDKNQTMMDNVLINEKLNTAKLDHIVTDDAIIFKLTDDMECAVGLLDTMPKESNNRVLDITAIETNSSTRDTMAKETNSSMHKISGKEANNSVQHTIVAETSSVQKIMAKEVNISLPHSSVQDKKVKERDCGKQGTITKGTHSNMQKIKANKTNIGVQDIIAKEKNINLRDTNVKKRRCGVKGTEKTCSGIQETIAIENNINVQDTMAKKTNNRHQSIVGEEMTISLQDTMPNRNYVSVESTIKEKDISVKETVNRHTLGKETSSSIQNIISREKNSSMLDAIAEKRNKSVQGTIAKEMNINMQDIIVKRTNTSGEGMVTEKIISLQDALSNRKLTVVKNTENISVRDTVAKNRYNSVQDIIIKKIDGNFSKIKAKEPNINLQDTMAKITLISKQSPTKGTNNSVQDTVAKIMHNSVQNMISKETHINVQDTMANITHINVKKPTKETNASVLNTVSKRRDSSVQNTMAKETNITMQDKMADKTLSTAQDTMPEAMETNSKDTEVCTEEEFKYYLIKVVLIMMNEKKYEQSVWTTLKKETGRDLKTMWKEIRDITIKKISCLLEANDLVSEVNTAMRLTAAEWLLVDQVLVHENSTLDISNNTDLECLWHLFSLAVKCNVENLVGEKLVEAWIDLTLDYNSRGRQCSPMLLQLRWYQLKMLARTHVFKDLQNRNINKILLTIATKYQKIITQKFRKWYKLIEDKCVILPKEFVTTIKEKAKWKKVQAREGWYLHITNELPDCNGIDNIKVNVINDYHINNVQINEVEKHKDKDTTKANHLSKSVENTKDNEVIELDSDDEINEILREKADNFKNISQKPLHCSNETTLDTSKNKSPVRLGDIEPIVCDSDDEMDQILQEKVNQMCIELPMNIKAHNVVKRKNHNDDIDEVDFDDNDIEFVDDGIEFEEGNDNIAETDETKTASSTDGENDDNSEVSKDGPEIDIKLLMNTIVYTRKVDCMEVFKFIDYDSVNDKRVLDYVEAESKPVNKHAPKDEEIVSFREQACAGHEKNNTKSDDDIDENARENIQVKYTSSLLKKPKRRIYRTTQLLRNPDFNTRLKPLNEGFLKSTRNLELLNKCHPVTIDVHKAFENKLIEGTMYLKRDNFKTARRKTDSHKVMIEPPESIPDVTEGQRRVLAGHRDLITTISSDDDDEDDEQITNVTPKLPVKRSKVINLPDKDQIRLINQSLQTAEITPRHQGLLNSGTTSDTRNKEGSSTTISSEASPVKRFKSDLELTPQYKTVYCCWAREEIVRINRRSGTDISRHACSEHSCTCCCRPALVTLLASKLSFNLYVPKSISDPKYNGFMNIKDLSKRRFKDTVVKLIKSDEHRKAINVGALTKEPHNVLKNTIDNKTSLIKHVIDTKASRQGKLLSTPNDHKALLEKEEILPYFKINQPIDKETTNQRNIPGNSATQNNKASKYVTYPSLLSKKVKSTHPHTGQTLVYMRNSHENVVSKVVGIPDSSPAKGYHKINPNDSLLKKNFVNTNIQAPKVNNINVLNYTRKPNILTSTETVTSVHMTAVKEPERVVDNSLPQVVIPQTDESQSLDPTQAQNVSSVAYLTMPNGVNFVNIAGEGLAVSINPGVEVDPQQLNSFLLVCAAVNGNQCTVPPLHYNPQLPNT